MTDAQWLRQHAMFERMLRAIIACPIPVIGAINGAAYGGGCEITAALDFAYASETARFALTEVTLGIMPGAGGTQNLPRAVGERRAKEVILTGLPFTAQDAFEWGLSIACCRRRSCLMQRLLLPAALLAMRRSPCVRPSSPSIAACRCRWPMASLLRSNATTAWYPPRTVLRACALSMKSVRQRFGEYEPWLNT